MKKFFLFILVFVTILATDSFAQLVPADSVITGDITSTRSLNSSKRYLLSGFVKVKSSATLIIPAGTIIMGEKNSKGTLIIERGGYLRAEGTAQRPIVFTSQSLPGQRGPGDWGGIIIAGRASLNVPGGEATLEGGTNTTYGGGSSPNDNDSSGVLRYVRIEFPGIAFQPDNEINGLTLGGVGRKTVIEYVQVAHSGDDSFEWFGGTVNGKYLIAIGGVDDDFDVDFGFNGNIQFAISMRDPNVADISGSNGIESDNDGTGTYNSPRTRPIFSNLSLIGPMADTSATRNPNYRRGTHIRRSSQTSLYNSLVMGWPTAALFDGSGVAGGANGDTLQVRNTIYAGLRFNNGITTNASGFNVQNWFNTAAYGNRSYVQPSEVGMVDAFNLTNPNPIPGAGSVAATGADFTNPRLVGSFFTPTTYVGAFGPSTTPRWDAGWANYNAQNTDYTVVSVEDEIRLNSYTMDQNYPNPFNPATTISFSIPVRSDVSVKVYDITGKLVSELATGIFEAGAHQVQFNASELASGVYMYQMIAGKNVVTKKMTLIK